jgi:outer membrane protein OmpA-like peptidoglycan-associated protein
MIRGSVVLWLRLSACQRRVAKVGCLGLVFALFAPSTFAQTLFSFKDDQQLAETMLQLASRAVKKMAMPEPCHLHIVAIPGGRELFTGDTFDKMNAGLARGIAGDRPLEKCQVATHELGRDGVAELYERVRPQGETALIFETTYIPLTTTIAVFTKLRDGTGRLIRESGRYDLPVKPANIIATAAIIPLPKALPKPDEAPEKAPEPEPVAAPEKAPEPAPVAAPETTASIKLTTKLLTEVHFDSGSADVTVVGERKIKQAIEAIKNQNPREIKILGFTDSKGNAAANKTIATARADRVARFLREAGLDVPMTVEGRGEDGGPHQIPDGVSEPLNRCVGIIAVDVPE